MTDFFADLEREIRAAHPRRPRPVVPVKGLAVTAVVAAALLAVVVGLGALTGVAEREVAQQPPAEEGWTAYAPLDCGGIVVDEPIPGGIVERFAILRGAPEAVTLHEDKVPAGIGAVVRESVRPLVGPEDREYVFAVARLAGENCEPSPTVPCLISPQSGGFTCVMKDSSEPLMSHFVDDLDSGRRVVAVLAEDRVSRASVELPGSNVVSELGIEANAGFEVIPGGHEDPEVRVAGERPPRGSESGDGVDEG